MLNKPKYIVIHCTDVSERDIWDQFKSVNTYHKSRDFDLSRLGFYVGYHVLITGGKAYQAREDDEMGCHCNQSVDGITMNLQSLGVCIGFDGDIEMPSPVHYDLLKKQVMRWQRLYNIPKENVFFHRHFATNKTCPGALLDQNWLDILLQYNPEILPNPKVPTQEENQIEIKNIQDQISFLTKLVIQLQALYNNLFKK